MTRQLSYLIIGNGIAGVTAAGILRAGDASCSITIIADDPFPVYYRPALKDYLGGRLPEEKLWARPSTFYKDQRIRFIAGRVIGINTLHGFVQLQDGQQIGYDKLLLASGARPRQLTCPGLDLAGVSTLRTVADYREVRRRLGDVKRVVICGSGTLAMESAETLQHCGYQVTHLLRGHTLWSEVLDPIASDLVLQEERRAGVDVRTGEEIAETVGKKGQVTGVITTSGAHIPCEMVLIAIGIEPLIDFIRVSGIACGRGVKVDNGMRTSNLHVYAAGDVIETTDEITGRTRVPGQWYPAIQQAQVAAYNMLGLLEPGHPSYPGSHSQARAAYLNYYNATFLYGLDFVSIGLTTRPPSHQRFQEIVADPQPRSYRKVLLKDGVIVGALLLGKRKDALALKRAIDHRVDVTAVANLLFADDFKLDEWLDRQGVPGPILNINKQSPAKSYDSGEYPAAMQSSGWLQRSLNANERTTASSHTSFSHLEGSQLHASVSRIIPDRILRSLDGSPTLVLVGQNTAPQVISLEQGRRYTLGRGRENDIVLEDMATSRRHAEIFTAPDGFYVRDLESRYGVFVNKVKINNPYHLSHGDRVVLGNTLVYFSWSQEPGATMSAGHEAPTREAIHPAAKGPLVVGLGHRSDVQMLSEERVKFEIDMCIGCNRCMDACPVPMSSLVTIAELNHATISEEIAPQVARFTHECIMCGSCVPVCPVDNHRDLLMLSLKQRLGVSWESKPDLKRVTAALPAGWTLPVLLSRMREQSILSNPQQVPENYLLHILAASHLRTFVPGEVVIQEGEYGRDLYLLLEGRLELFASDIEGNEFPVAMLRRGEYMGEDGMLTGQPYKATACAQAPALVLQVPEQVMQRLMELVPGVGRHFEQFYNARSLKSILKRMALFQGVSDADLQALIRQTPVKHYERNERLFAEDDQGGRPARETLHILLEGFVKVARHTVAGTGKNKGDERIVAYRQAGDYFAGGLDLLGDGRAVSVTAINRVRVAEVPRQAMLALFQAYPEVNQRFTVRLQEYLETAVSTQGYALASGPLKHVTTSLVPAAAVQAGLHSLVSNGVVEGTEVLLIDLDKCIHCNECEEACARRHGHSRMNRKGMVVGNISIATACRQCQDPVCMLCSRAGIARLPNGEVSITESCIGCGICAERCPYGAISIMNLEGEMAARSSWQRFSEFFSRGSGKERARRNLPMLNAAPGPLDTSQSQHGYDELRKKVAIKCDLCAGYKDQACVEACPTGAAIRIQPTRFFGSTEEILRRRVV